LRVVVRRHNCLVNEAKNIEALKALAEKRPQADPRPRLASVRVSPGGYLAAASILTFASVLLLRADRHLLALTALAISWLAIPALAFSDRIAFDGHCLSRQGIIPFIRQLISGRKQQLDIADLERVDTTAVRTLRRGGSVRYRYRSQIIGRNMGFIFASGGGTYLKMVRHLFPLINEEKIDIRTRELRDYLCEPKLLRQKVESLHLASPEVLEKAIADFRLGGKELHGGGLPTVDRTFSAEDVERARLLRCLANELRVAGRLREAGEAFRRALMVTPRDGRLIYEFARLLRAQASAQGDAGLLSRARAAFRLSAIRAANNARLLSLIGESFLECGDADNAQRTFRQALDQDARSFRARLGLAEIALRDGKLAHVVHHYRDAIHAACDKALTLYARREADYYARLNDDDDYLAAELRRIGWLQNVARIRQLAARATNASILLALVGPYIDQAVAGTAWSLASSAVVAWISTLLAGKFLSERRRPHPID
jgi:tetratricopeptide (TPR) repeat protein